MRVKQLEYLLNNLNETSRIKTLMEFSNDEIDLIIDNRDKEELNLLTREICIIKKSLSFSSKNINDQNKLISVLLNSDFSNKKEILNYVNLLYISDINYRTIDEQTGLIEKALEFTNKDKFNNILNLVTNIDILYRRTYDEQIKLMDKLSKVDDIDKYKNMCSICTDSNILRIKSTDEQISLIDYLLKVNDKDKYENIYMYSIDKSVVSNSTIEESFKLMDILLDISDLYKFNKLCDYSKNEKFLKYRDQKSRLKIISYLLKINDYNKFDINGEYFSSLDELPYGRTVGEQIDLMKFITDVNDYEKFNKLFKLSNACDNEKYDIILQKGIINKLLELDDDRFTTMTNFCLESVVEPPLEVLKLINYLSNIEDVDRFIKISNLYPDYYFSKNLKNNDKISFLDNLLKIEDDNKFDKIVDLFMSQNLYLLRTKFDNKLELMEELLKTDNSIQLNYMNEIVTNPDVLRYTKNIDTIKLMEQIFKTSDNTKLKYITYICTNNFMLKNKPIDEQLCFIDKILEHDDKKVLEGVYEMCVDQNCLEDYTTIEHINYINEAVKVFPISDNNVETLNFNSKEDLITLLNVLKSNDIGEVGIKSNIVLNTGKVYSLKR